MDFARRNACILIIGCLAILSFPPGAAATDLGVISGKVRDSGGLPVAGALVLVVGSSPNAPERMVFTDRHGAFYVPHLFADKYSIRVTTPRFLPALKHGIQVNPGGAAVLVVNLQNALDIARRGVSRSKESDDIIWTLRSSRATQSILRLAEERSKEETPSSVPLSDYSGYFQLYSKSVETATGPSEGVGSKFSVTMPVDATSQFTVAGQYSEVPTEPRGFGALYEFTNGERHRAQIGVNVRQGALFGDPLWTNSLKEVQLKYGEDFQWSNHLVLNYGAELGRADAISDRSYVRPRFGVSWIPDARTTFSVSATSQAPAAADDPIRGKEYFDRMLYVPPALERYSHMEAGVSRLLSEKFEISAAAFRDSIDIQALFVGTPEGRRGVMIFDTRGKPSTGVRVHVNRKFRGFEAGIGYATATGIGLKMAATDTKDLQNQLIARNFQVLTARLKADVDMTQTEITAIYRWMSGFSASRIDPYQQAFEYNDPTLSLTVAQDLPAWRMFPGKIQAILDARNVFEHSFGAHRTQVAQYPRLVKGGINIRF